MFNVAICKFLGSANNAGVRVVSANKDYEYRIPAHLDGKVQIGMLAVVSWKGGNEINPSVVEIVEIKNVLDGSYDGTDFAWVIGAVDRTQFDAVLQADRRRKKLFKLIEAERDRVTSKLDLNALAAMSPELYELVAELKAMDAPVSERRAQAAGAAGYCVPDQTPADKFD